MIMREKIYMFLRIHVQQLKYQSTTPYYLAFEPERMTCSNGIVSDNVLAKINLSEIPYFPTGTVTTY